MDHSVRRSMKNAANCVKYGELQGSRNRYMSNAYGAFIFMMEARLSEGLLNGIDHLLSGYGLSSQGSRGSLLVVLPWILELTVVEEVVSLLLSPASSRASADSHVAPHSATSR